MFVEEQALGADTWKRHKLNVSETVLIVVAVIQIVIILISYRSTRPLLEAILRYRQCFL